jgi:hypothetical protein
MIFSHEPLFNVPVYFCLKFMFVLEAYIWVSFFLKQCLTYSPLNLSLSCAGITVMCYHTQLRVSLKNSLWGLRKKQ